MEIEAGDELAQVSSQPNFGSNRVDFLSRGSTEQNCYGIPFEGVWAQKWAQSGKWRIFGCFDLF